MNSSLDGTIRARMPSHQTLCPPDSLILWPRWEQHAEGRQNRHVCRLRAAVAMGSGWMSARLDTSRKARSWRGDGSGCRGCGRAASAMGRCRPIMQRLGPPPSLRATAAVLATTRTRAWTGCRLEGRTFRARALENEGRGMGRGSEGPAAPDPQAGALLEGGLGFPSSLMVCRPVPKRSRPLPQA